MKLGDTFLYNSDKIFHISMEVGDHRLYEFIQPNTLYRIKRMYDFFASAKKTVVFEKIKGEFDIKKYLSSLDENHFFKVNGGCKTYNLHLDSFQLVTDQVENLKDFTELSEYRNKRLNKILN